MAIRYYECGLCDCAFIGKEATEHRRINEENKKDYTGLTPDDLKRAYEKPKAKEELTECL